MGTRRLIAIANQDGYDYIHLSYDGENAASLLDSNWSTASAARELISGGNIAVLAANDVERSAVPGRNVGNAVDLKDLLSCRLANEHLISIFDEGEGTRDALDDMEGRGQIDLEIDNPNSSGSWIHLADEEAVLFRDDIAAERAEIQQAV